MATYFFAGLIVGAFAATIVLLAILKKKKK